MSPQPVVTAIVVDDHPFFRDGISRQLTLSGQVNVVAEADNAEDALRQIRELQPDVAVIDYQLPGMNGIELIKSVTREELPTGIILLSAVSDGEVVFEAIAEGARGYVAKDSSRAEVISAVLSVAKGGTVLPPQLAGGLAEQIRFVARTRGPLLTDRELEVLRAFARGLSIPQLASELYLSPSTVKSHTQRLYEKLGVSDRAAAVAEGLRHRLIE